jgi:hypothetical protein
MQPNVRDSANLCRNNKLQPHAEAGLEQDSFLQQCRPNVKLFALKTKTKIEQIQGYKS